MIANYWPPWFKALYGGDWPTTYCCVDVETTGFSLDRDVITEWGHCLVVDGQIKDSLSVVVDWTGHDVVPEHWLRSRLDALQQSMRLNGTECHMSIERMQTEGTKPNRVLEFVRDFTNKIKSQGILFVAHNGMFDENMLSANMLGFKVAKGFTFGDNGWIDTDGIEKASQCLQNERVHPRKGDTLRSYWHRVRYTRVSGVKSSLGDHCYAKYDFAGKGYPKDQMHGAKTDAICTHLLMEEYRKLIVPGAQPEIVYPLADQKAERQGKPIAMPQQQLVAAGPPKRLRGQRNS